MSFIHICTVTPVLLPYPSVTSTRQVPRDTGSSDRSSPGQRAVLATPALTAMRPADPTPSPQARWGGASVPVLGTGTGTEVRLPRSEDVCGEVRSDQFRRAGTDQRT